MNILDLITSPAMALSESIQDRQVYNRYRAAARAQGQDVPQLGIFASTPDVPMDWLQGQMVTGPLADSRNTATGLYYGGGINGGQYQAALQGADQSVYSASEAMRRTKVSSGPAWANYFLNKARFDAEQGELAAARAGTAQWNDFIMSNPDYGATEAEQRAFGAATAAGATAEAQRVVDAVVSRYQDQQGTIAANNTQTDIATDRANALADAGGRSPTFYTLPDEVQSDVLNLESEIPELTEAIDYFANTTAAQRAQQPEVTGRFTSVFRRIGAGAVNTYLDGGDMSEGQLEFVGKILGDPTGVNLTNRDIGSARSIEDMLRTRYRNLQTQYPGLSLNQDYAAGANFRTLPADVEETEEVPRSGGSNGQPSPEMLPPGYVAPKERFKGWIEDLTSDPRTPIDRLRGF